MNGLLLRLKRGQRELTQKHIDQFMSQEKLEIIAPDLDSLPEQIVKLTNLKTFNATVGALVDWPNCFWQLQSLERIKVVSTQGIQLPAKIDCKLNSLRFLTLKDCKLKSLPSWFDQLIKLEELSLSGNELGELPEFIGNFKNLKRLNLDGNNLTKLPKSVLQLSSLNHISIEKNNLTDNSKQEIYDHWKIIVE